MARPRKCAARHLQHEDHARRRRFVTACDEPGPQWSDVRGVLGPVCRSAYRSRGEEEGRGDRSCTRAGSPPLSGRLRDGPDVGHLFSRSRLASARGRVVRRSLGGHAHRRRDLHCQIANAHAGRCAGMQRAGGSAVPDSIDLGENVLGTYDRGREASSRGELSIRSSRSQMRARVTVTVRHTHIYRPPLLPKSNTEVFRPQAGHVAASIRRRTTSSSSHGGSANQTTSAHGGVASGATEPGRRSWSTAMGRSSQRCAIVTLRRQPDPARDSCAA